jgi:hypothetical protein
VIVSVSLTGIYPHLLSFSPPHIRFHHPRSTKQLLPILNQLSPPQPIIASEAHHLLTIPRELRDIVYEHLAQKLSFRWEWEHGVDNIGDEGNPTRLDVGVQLLNCPIPMVSRAYSRLHDEYKDAACSWELEAEIFLNMFS